MVDAQDWLTKHCPTHFRGDRLRGDPVKVETLEPGDIDENGNCTSRSGLIVTGREGIAIWMTSAKAVNAAYYGWVGAGPVGTDPTTGERLYAMIRRPC